MSSIALRRHPDNLEARQSPALRKMPNKLLLMKESSTLCHNSVVQGGDMTILLLVLLLALSTASEYLATFLSPILFSNTEAFVYSSLY